MLTDGAAPKESRDEEPSWGSDCPTWKSIHIHILSLSPVPLFPSLKLLPAQRLQPVGDLGENQVRKASNPGNHPEGPLPLTTLAGGWASPAPPANISGVDARPDLAACCLPLTSPLQLAGSKVGAGEGATRPGGSSSLPRRLEVGEEPRMGCEGAGGRPGELCRLVPNTALGT